MHAQGSACQCYVLHIIICKLGESLHWPGGDIKARKRGVRVEGTKEVQGAANIILLCFHIPLAHYFGPRTTIEIHAGNEWNWTWSASWGGKGGRGYSEFQVTKWQGWSNGGKNQNPKKSLGIQTKPPKNPCTKIQSPKNPMPNFRTIKIFQKALNDITRK